VRDLVAHYHGESEASKRQVLTENTVTQDQRGLRQLIKAGCYRAAVNLTGKLLQMYNQGVGQQQQGGSLAKHTPSSLQVGLQRNCIFYLEHLVTTFSFSDLVYTHRSARQTAAVFRGRS
jgi:hypothetical protein